MRKNCKDVLNAWLNKNPLTNGSISTDGESVYSYRLCIAKRDSAGKVKVLTRDYGGTRTTSHHINACWDTYPHAASVEKV